MEEQLTGASRDQAANAGALCNYAARTQRSPQRRVVAFSGAHGHLVAHTACILPLAQPGAAPATAPRASLVLTVGGGVGGAGAAAGGVGAPGAPPQLRLRRIAGRGCSNALHSTVTLVDGIAIDVSEIAAHGETPGFRGMSFSAASSDRTWRQQLYGVDYRTKNHAHVLRVKPDGILSSSKDTRVAAGDLLHVYGKAATGLRSPLLATFRVELVDDAAAAPAVAARADAASGAVAMVNLPPHPEPPAAATPFKVPFGADKPVLSGGSDERHDRRRCSSLVTAAADGGGVEAPVDGAAALAADAVVDAAMPDVACSHLPQPVRAFMPRASVSCTSK